ncbi:restriction endonuclease subunit S [Streptomyces griseus]|uniref:restriction endonuclease subunit S n=1 Tax=Streptomyces griseus TaxID=1911 RepID=UPI0009A0D11D|nr:restriction endonuclease subunit S [Streptomyces griseus]
MTWQETRMKFLCVDSGQYGLNISADEYTTSGTRLIRTSDIAASGALKAADTGVYIDAQPGPRHQLHRGDILLSRSGTLGRSFLVPAEANGQTFAGFLIRFRPAHYTNPRFLHYATQSKMFQGIVHSEAVSSTIQNFNAERYANVPMRAPAADVQRRIADFLDGETARTDHLHARVARFSELLNERQASLLARCFTADDDHHTKRAVTVPLRRIIERWIDYRGATPEKTASGIPLVTARNIREGKIDLAASREYIAEDAYKVWMRRGLPMHGDVLLTTEAPLGQVARIFDSGVALAQRIILLRPDPEQCSTEWLYWYLRSPQGQAELALRATGSTAVGIKADRLRSVPIPLLDTKDIQERLSDLRSHVSQVERCKGELTRQSNLLAERRQALITAAVTGQFDVSTASGRNVTDGVPTS